MGRQYKFRALDYVNQNWVYGSCVVINNGIEVVECIWELNSTRATPIDSSTLGQFTGLTDKNGVEIYEGDIIKAPTDFGPAGFEEKLHVIKYDFVQGYGWNYVLIDHIEVIGNIYQHKHLLKESEEHGSN